MKLIDSHCHLDDERFDDDREEVINSLYENNIEYVINPGSDLESSKASFELSQIHDQIYACVGTHPHEATFYTTEVEKEYLKMSENKKVVGIGEIGLDYHYDNSPRDIQKDVFIRQIKLAKSLDLPIVIHSRDASGDTLEILKKEASGMKVMLHAFSESLEIMREYLKLGFYISMGGVVTFKNAKKAKEAMKEVPLERLLIETDSPYLTPEPFRGRRNNPTYVKYVAKEIAKLKGISLKEISQITTENAKDFFGIND